MKCKADGGHTILEMEGLQIRLVRCERCKGEGPFRVPRAKTKAKLKETADRRRAAARKRHVESGRGAADTLRRLLEDRDLTQATKYAVSLTLGVGDLISHPSFGVGVVTAVNDPGKAHILFEAGERVMACNRH
jgi:hypothetical protein